MKRLFKWLGLVFLLMNMIAWFHAWRFTHFNEGLEEKTPDARHLSLGQKLHALILGVDNPRPVNTSRPSHPFKTIRIKSNKWLECWWISASDSEKTQQPAGNAVQGSHATGKVARGTIILFHGYGGSKSGLLDKSDEFLRMGYNTLLVDFMGSGGSEGNQTTIGYKEAEEVKDCLRYLESTGEKNTYLFGTSMGAVAILKAMHDYPLSPRAILIECPFGSLYQTTCARFRSLGAPVFPMAGLLVFWGGVQNGFPAFAFNPVRYAGAVTCPCLLLYGEKDEKVSRREIDELFSSLKGPKRLATYPLAGHENYLVLYRDQWKNDVESFLRERSSFSP